ncbi:hypothetical protein A3762_06645 [Oleiphilus sp. HI0125]|uniref:hypothetical protein n=1 Tax=Oleiphilus sp. HI0125 TaxID=1822266 RepID=UPI0007C2F146|nr:hypothetical protein [Oleiphilus sp. HI0125]KZZ58846.1 hypothetical protein A3762_06645 [Oleiphilus sp. HI0125]
MPYSLTKIFNSFKADVEELERIVHALSSQPESIERDTHIEGCFIRLVVSWECFVEEYFLRCMCTANTRSNRLIRPHGSSSRNVNEAFKKINKHRKDRDKEFTDWLDSKLLQQRIDDYFRRNSRVQNICESPDKMYELRVIRNAIAHRSPSAIAKFEKHVKDQMGYLAALNPTMASLLIQQKRNSNDLIFTILSRYFYSLADRLTK